MPPRRGRKKNARGTRRTSSTRRVAKVDPDTILDSILDEAVARLGLDILGLSQRDYREILKPIVEGIVSAYSSRPSREAVLSKITGNPRPVYVYTAIYLLNRFEELTSDQIEFIVSNAPEVAGRYAARIYKEVVRTGREDLLPHLRQAWEIHGTPTYVSCPYCGFRAILPDYTCAVCGKEISEKVLKSSIGFDLMLEEYAELYGEHGLKEAITRGYVVLRDTLYPPGEEDRLSLRLYLSRKEIDRLKELLRKRTNSPTIMRV